MSFSVFFAITTPLVILKISFINTSTQLVESFFLDKISPFLYKEDTKKLIQTYFA